eukprot:7260429-Pyramimonas_sp.AAC.1
MRGHTNDKNFVGLSVSQEFIACGSETNEVFVYQKQVSKPMCTYYFQGAHKPAEGQEAKAQFISA